jgi:hypothetical protein
MESRAAERHPWRSFGWVIFVPGLFHLKMACADALHRIFLAQEHRDGPNSLVRYVDEVRVKDNGTFKTDKGPQWRPMHEFIQHVGIASQLDCWRVAAGEAQPEVLTLDKWAESNPSWNKIVSMSRMMCRRFVGNKNLTNERQKPEDCRDKDLENTLIREQYFMLYEELAWAINAGDVGRVEQCIIPWIGIFQGCGKSTYSRQFTKFLYNLHFVYPEGLRSDICSVIDD